MDKEVRQVASTTNPFRDFDRLAERMLSSASDAAMDLRQSMRLMPVDLYRDGDKWVMHCDLPGVDPESIDVSLDGRMLTLRAARTPREGEVEWLRRERPTGQFVRQLTLGAAVDTDGIQADYNEGVLSVTLPLAEKAKPRRIEVNSSTKASIAS